MTRQLKHAVLIAVLMMISSTLACSLSASDEATLRQEAELQTAYEHYREVMIEAFETGDTQYLGDVATGDWLASNIKQLESPGAHSSGLHENAQVIDVKVLHYGFTIAAVEFREKWSRKAGDTEVWYEDTIYCEFIREAHGYDWKVSFYYEEVFANDPEM